jgi:hypothetical protein
MNKAVFCYVTPCDPVDTHRPSIGMHLIVRAANGVGGGQSGTFLIEPEHTASFPITL